MRISTLLVALGCFVMACGRLGEPSLSIDPRCRNEIDLRHDGDFWLTQTELPIEWQNLGKVEGEFQRLSDTEAQFVTVDGVTIMLLASSGSTGIAMCEAWQ